MRKEKEAYQTREKSDLHSFSRAGHSILANGSALKGTGSEFKYGLIRRNTKGSGDRIKLAVKGNSGMQTAITLTAVGKMIKQTDMECTYIQTGRNMKGTGKMIFRMATGLKPGRAD
jgi:hypothetical protein